MILPSALTAVPNWVTWRSEQRNGGKPTKVPYSLVTGRRASSTEPSDWAPFPAEPPENIGFVFTKSLRITGIDLDDCLTEDGFPKPWAAIFMERFASTYSEVSPSGRGVKIWAGGSIPGSGKKVYITTEGVRTAEGSADIDGAVEMYDTGRYFTVTGKATGPLEVVDCQPLLDELYAKLAGERKPSQKPQSNDILGEGSRHGYLLASAAQWRQNGLDREGILIGLRELNQRKCNPPKPERELIGIIDWLANKPAKYRLVPADFKASAQPSEEPTPDSPPDGETSLEVAERLLVAAIDSKDLNLIFGRGAELSDLIRALAKAGSIKQAEAKRRLRNALPAPDFPIREWDARIKKAEQEAREDQAAFSEYLLNKDGGMLANVANAIRMMGELPIRYNSFTCRVYLESSSPWHTSGEWTDHDDVKAAEWCQHKFLNVRPDICAQAAATIAKDRFPYYHPVADYLRNLKWDGIARCDKWMVDYLGGAETKFVADVSAKWMIAAVKRAMEPGCQSDYTLVLEGSQGRRKSTALRTLAGSEWFSDDIADIGTKDSAMQLQGKWIIELAELDAIRRAAEITTVKAWLVRRIDNFRPPYGRRPEDFPRQNVFAASTNRDDWGMDETGLRRFWPVKVGEIDISGLSSARDQLWAEAYSRYKSGEAPYLTGDAELAATAEQAIRQDTDSWDESVLEWVSAPAFRASKDSPSLDEPMRSRPGRVILPEILQHCLGIPKKDWSPTQRQRVSKILRLAGYVSRRALRSEADSDGHRPDFWEPMKHS